MYRFIYITVFFLVIALPLKAQENLVPNGSFEEYNNCPSGGGISWVKNWYSPTLGSPDYFNICATNSQFEVPQNTRGYQIPKTGGAYAGFFARANDDAREYLQVELKKELEAGKKYAVQFYLNLADFYAVSVWNIGMHLSNTAISSPLINIYVLNVTPQILNEKGNFLNWEDWTEVKVNYTSHGGEKFITIGNFYTEANTDTMLITGGQYSPSTYIFIDDVSITEIICEPIFHNVFTPNNDDINEHWQPILCLDDNEQVNITIYNRWGQKVYEAVNKAAYWDGRTTSGNNCPEGTYYYIITTTKETYKGTIQLLR
ncbi:MAG: gliding motility-associated C-terminal domain-containing protein [Vicingaceae bacterium]|nr:gliding motility-associated C-terminal domain-containing protein [Flavobacteriales bacterium]MDF1676801.1 gliding motility-associated C-terminal domain-containing protein [Vicingaceae bacterium]